MLLLSISRPLNESGFFYALTLQATIPPARDSPLSNPSKIAYTLLKNKKAELSDLSDKLLSGLHKAPIQAN